MRWLDPANSASNNASRCSPLRLAASCVAPCESEGMREETVEVDAAAAAAAVVASPPPPRPPACDDAWRRHDNDDNDDDDDDDAFDDDATPTVLPPNKPTPAPP